MRNLHESIRAYVSMRRGMGFKIKSAPEMLNRFVKFLRSERSDFITTAALIRYVSFREIKVPGTKATLLSTVRGFARYRKWEDPRTEIPLSRLYPNAGPSKSVHIFTPLEIKRIASAFLNRRSWNIMSRDSQWAIFCTLANTGMRQNEVLSLEMKDVDLANGVLTVRATKFLKSRLVPIHKSARKALMRFAERRASYLGHRRSKIFFCNSVGSKIYKTEFYKNARRAFDEAGVRRLGEKGARIHDLRHTFAVNTIENWYKKGENVNLLLPRLATYLGHNSIRHTYWYLSFTTHLKGEAVKLLEIARRRESA